MKTIGKAGFFGKVLQLTNSAVMMGALAGALALGTQKASAQGLLTIDDSDPSHVLIIATGANSGANSTEPAIQGVDLLAFFNGSQPLVNVTNANGTLTGGNSGSSYDTAISDNTTANGFIDLNLYASTSSGSQVFSTTQPAFTGQWILDLSGLGVGVLPSMGASGNIMSGFSGSSTPGVVIGTWQVAAVPEPGTTSLAVIGFAVTGFALLRQRRKAAKN